MQRVNDCLAALKKSNLEVVMKGFTSKEAGEAFCTACRYDKSFDGNITKELIGKMLTAQWPTVSKSVLGGIDHVISVDNGANYAELWYKGGNWYTLTGADLKKSKDWDSFGMVTGITKGMGINEAMPRFLEAVFGPLTKSEKPCPCGN